MLLSKLIVLDTVDSTSNYIANLLKTQQIQHGTAILSYNQQKGRGQRGTNWLSEPYKNIACSIFLKHTTVHFGDIHYLSYAVALAVKDFLKSYNIDAKIKWPNDLLVANKKIAGILIENQFTGSTLTSSIVGVGINVNQVFPDDSSFLATSMTKIQEQTFHLETLSYAFIACLEKRYLQFQQGDFLALTDVFLASLWKKGEWVTVLIADQTHTVKIEGIDASGYLVLKVNGILKTFDIKEVKFVLS